MQYLECLAAALSDMAHTYQPAERMSTVLRAVMVELRGGPDPLSATSFSIYKPPSSLIPARRSSTIDTDADMTSRTTQSWHKKRQMSLGSTPRPRANTSGTRHKRTMSSSTTVTSPPLHPSLSLQAAQVPPPPPRFDDHHHSDNYILIPPSSSDPPPWCPDLNHTLSTPSTTASSSSLSQSRHNTGWIRSEYEAQDAISALASAHFPELSAFGDELGSAGGGAGGGGEGRMNLDFMPLGEEWEGGVMGVGSDLDGFPIQGKAF